MNLKVQILDWTGHIVGMKVSIGKVRSRKDGALHFLDTWHPRQAPSSFGCNAWYLLLKTLKKTPMKSYIVSQN